MRANGNKDRCMGVVSTNGKIRGDTTKVNIKPTGNMVTESMCTEMAVGILENGLMVNKKGGEL